jgi:tetratricopeptide (TPR) repeat protein
MNNLITAEIPRLLPVPEPPYSERELIANVLYDQYINILNDIIECNVISTEQTLAKLDSLLVITDPNLKAAALATLGGVHTFTGNYGKAFAAFYRALRLVRTSEMQAVVFSELSNLLRKLGYREEALTVLDEALVRTHNDNLMWRLKAQQALCLKYSDPELAIRLLTEVMDYYADHGNWTRVARGETAFRSHLRSHT